MVLFLTLRLIEWPRNKPAQNFGTSSFKEKEMQMICGNLIQAEANKDDAYQLDENSVSVQITKDLIS